MSNKCIGQTPTPIKDGSDLSHYSTVNTVMLFYKVEIYYKKLRVSKRNLGKKLLQISLWSSGHIVLTVVKESLNLGY